MVYQLQDYLYSIQATDQAQWKLNTMPTSYFQRINGKLQPNFNALQCKYMQRTKIVVSCNVTNNDIKMF